MLDKSDLVIKAFTQTGTAYFTAFAHEFATDGQQSVQSRNKSLFSTLIAVLKAAPDDSTDSHRDILSRIEHYNKKLFEGVKADNLKKLIWCLFGNGESLSPRDWESFRNYNRANLLAYIEICRRIFLVTQTEGIANLRIPDRQPNAGAADAKAKAAGSTVRKPVYSKQPLRKSAERNPVERKSPEQEPETVMGIAFRKSQDGKKGNRRSH